MERFNLGGSEDALHGAKRGQSEKAINILPDLSSIQGTHLLLQGGSAGETRTREEPFDTRLSGLTHELAHETPGYLRE